MGLIPVIVQLPEGLWKASDAGQFKWLDNEIGGNRQGMTWHHTEIHGEMVFLPFGNSYRIRNRINKISS